MEWKKSLITFGDEILCENCGRPKRDHGLIHPDDIICPKKRPGWDDFMKQHGDSLISTIKYLAATEKGSQTGWDDLLKMDTRVPVVSNDLRERAAIAAMQAMLGGKSNYSPEHIAICAVEAANALVKELNKHNP